VESVVDGVGKIADRGRRSARPRRTWRFWVSLASSVACVASVVLNSYAVSFDDTAVSIGVVVGIGVVALVVALGTRVKPPQSVTDIPLVVVPFSDWAARSTSRTAATAVASMAVSLLAWGFGTGSVKALKLGCNSAVSIQSKVGLLTTPCVDGQLWKVWSIRALPELECSWSDGKRTTALRREDRVECQAPIEPTGGTGGSGGTGGTETGGTASGGTGLGEQEAGGTGAGGAGPGGRSSGGTGAGGGNSPKKCCIANTKDPCVCGSSVGRCGPCTQLAK
jgi:hypothetical protein